MGALFDADPQAWATVIWKVERPTQISRAGFSIAAKTASAHSLVSNKGSGSTCSRPVWLGVAAVRRLDQATGAEPEPVAPVLDEAAPGIKRRLLEPTGGSRLAVRLGAR